MKVVIDSQWIPLGTHWHYTSHSLWWCCEVRYFIGEPKAWRERGHWGMGGAQRSPSASFTAVLSCFYGDLRLSTQSVNGSTLFIRQPWVFLCKYWQAGAHWILVFEIVPVESEARWICNLRIMFGLNWVSFGHTFVTRQKQPLQFSLLPRLCVSF